MPSRQRSERFETFLALTSRIFVWGLLFGILILLRSFFLLIFLTFVFAYIQGTGVKKLQKKVPNRVVCAVLVGLALLLVLLGVGGYLVPKFKEQANLFADSYPRYVQSLDAGLSTLIERFPILEKALIHEDTTPGPISNGGSGAGVSGVVSESQLHVAGYSPTLTLLNQVFGLESDSSGQLNLKPYISILRNVGSSLLAIGSAFLLSLLFSFLIVLDLPALSESVRSLKDTKLQFVYEEVADSIRDFGVVVGRAMEAQLFIGLINTLLTSAGLVLLGLGGQLAFLAVIVFVCSFIPVAGAFISSVPICLIALREPGLGLVFACIILICVIHFIEAYILNPKIYGHHMRMNPVIVLIILTIGGKLFHVWGLVLGVPLCNYIFGHAIQRKSELLPEQRN